MGGIGRFEVLGAAALVALGVGSAGYFAGKTVYNGKVGINTAEVKGLAERRVSADHAYWTIGYTVGGPAKADVSKLYEQSEANQKRIVDLLLESGFDKSEITPGVVDFEKREFRDEGQRLVEESFLLTGSVDVQTDKVQRVAEVRAKLNKLIAEGLSIQNNAPAYHFTRLNEIKPAMLKEATANARAAANEFAANAGVAVGGIRDATQGGFLVQDVGEEYGDTKRIDKDVRVVTTITFYLTE